MTVEDGRVTVIGDRAEEGPGRADGRSRAGVAVKGRSGALGALVLVF